uniref:TATA element modulatory factor 1 TATA binding domain-containing protein n=1 Tax=Arcella intermedia TaxID=1963864 RepID=A0A6B2KYV7_9EUKA
MEATKPMDTVQQEDHLITNEPLTVQPPPSPVSPTSPLPAVSVSPSGEGPAVLSPMVSPPPAVLSHMLVPSSETPTLSTINYKGIVENLVLQLGNTKALLEERELKIKQLALENSRLLAQNEYKGNQQENIAALTAEKENYRKAYLTLKTNLENSTKEKDLIISQKDARLAKEMEITKQLTTEGENLSQKILKLQDHNRKLKAEKEAIEKEFLVVSERERGQAEKLKKKTDDLNLMIANEKQMQDALEQMRSVSGLATKQLEKREMDRTSAVDQVADLKDALEKSWIEITDLRKHQASLIQKHRVEIEHRENQLKLEHQKQLIDTIREETKKQEELKGTIKTLRESLGQNRGAQEDRVTVLEEENKQLNKKILRLEQQNSDLVESQAETAKPLLRQIGELESQLKSMHHTFTTLETSLRSRLLDQQNIALEAKHEVDQLKEQVLGWQGKHKSLTANLQHAQNTNQLLNKKLERKKLKCRSLQDTIEQFKNQLSDLSMTTDKANNQLLEKLTLKSKQLNELEENLVIANNEISALKTKLAKAEQVSQITENPSYHTATQQSYNGVPLHMLSPSTSLSIQKIQQTIDQKNSQITSLQSTIQFLNKSKQAMEDQLVQVTTKTQALEERINLLNSLENEHKELKTKFGAVLELLGEKTEKCIEMKNDIEDLKGVYKQQIDMLCREIEKLTKENHRLNGRK